MHWFAICEYDDEAFCTMQYSDEVTAFLAVTILLHKGNDRGNQPAISGTSLIILIKNNWYFSTILSIRNDIWSIFHLVFNLIMKPFQQSVVFERKKNKQQGIGQSSLVTFMRKVVMSGVPFMSPSLSASFLALLDKRWIPLPNISKFTASENVISQVTNT